MKVGKILLKWLSSLWSCIYQFHLTLKRLVTFLICLNESSLFKCIIMASSWYCWLCESWYLCPTGYKVLHVSISHSAGGGVGIIFKNSSRMNTSLTDQFHSFELMDFHLSIVRCVRILLLYRPPGLSTSLFLEEFSKLLEYITADQRQKRLLIAGDFNIHVDNLNDTTARQFLDLLDCFHLVQHVTARKHMQWTYSSFGCIHGSFC